LHETELKTLKTAIINEVEGEHFYRLAAADNNDEQARQAFLYLAGEENKHQRWLRDAAGKLAAGNPLTFSAGDFEETPRQNIFDRFHPGTETGSLAVSAMHIGILLEKASVDYYREAASLTSLAEIRQLYEKLASWELAHLEYFEKVYDDLKEEWWQQQGFSPS
jgi:rubrerythrin